MRDKNFIVCVTGKSGVGKSMFSKMLAARLDFFYVDIDKIGHKIYEDKKVVEKVESIFQQKLTDENGNFDRKRLGGILFSEKDLSKVEKFNNFTKRCMQSFINKELSLHKNVVLDWILLPKTIYWNGSDYKILIRPQNYEERFRHVQNRDGLSEEYLKLRDCAGIDYEVKDFDFVITNDYQMSDFEENLTRVQEKIFMRMRDKYE